MVLLASFRYAENTLLMFFAPILLVPLIVAVWGRMRYPQTARYANGVIGVFGVFIALHGAFWLGFPGLLGVVFQLIHWGSPFFSLYFFLVYLGFSIALCGAIYDAYKQERLVR